MADDRDERGPLLEGLTVVNLGTSTASAFAAQFLSDAGAEVVDVEPPEGSPLRSSGGWPAWARGHQSIALDLKTHDGRSTLEGLLRGADVLLAAGSPDRLHDLDLGAGRLAAINPRLVSALITGWGSRGPWRDIPGHEALVMAKLGYFHIKRQAAGRPGPAFISVPYASWGAAHTAVQGILAALYERQSSGRGQHVEADLVRGVATIDTWNWFFELVGQRWPDAFTLSEVFDEQQRPTGKLVFPLLVTPTRDGHWLQFAQVEPRLFLALLTELDLLPVLADPKYAGFPEVSADLRAEFWHTMLDRASSRTLGEWEQIFATNPNISAEQFRACATVLDHPQLVHDGRSVVSIVAGLGPVRQPSTLVHQGGRPLSGPAAPPVLDDNGEELRRRAAVQPLSESSLTASDSTELPLAGVTVLELSTMYAAPYGATLLTDLGARVIKVETFDGDGIRHLMGFPEATGAKVLQGKESIAVDVKQPAGLRIVHQLAAVSDVVLQSYRAGTAERIGVDEKTLTDLNPNLIYLSAPGYGTDGPYAARPAYAPSMGAAGGLALTDAPDAAENCRGLENMVSAAIRLFTAGNTPSLQADGVAALGVGSAIVLALLARSRGRRVHEWTTSMLASASHLLTEWVTDYPNRPAAPTRDSGGYGLGPLYRLYAAADGWVFLAVQTPEEWAALAAGLADAHGLRDLRTDERFASSDARLANSDALTAELATIFAARSAQAWEQDLTALSIGCVVVADVSPEKTLLSDEAFEAGYSALAHSPVFDEHRRLSPVNSFSRSRTQALGGCLVGEHTDSILAELRYTAEHIAELRESKVVQ